MTTETQTPASSPSTETTSAADDGLNLDAAFLREEDQTEHLDDVFGFGSAPKKVSSEEDGVPPSDDAAVGTASGDGEALGKAASPEPKADPEPVATDDRDLQIDSLKNQLADLQKAQEEAAKATPVQEPGTEEKPAAPKQPDPIKIELPQEAIDGLFSEDADVARQTMNEIVSGIYTSVNNNLHMLVQSLPQLISAEVQKLQTGGDKGGTTSTTAKADDAGGGGGDDQAAKAATMRTEYFADFPQHNKPELEPVISIVAQEMAKEFPGARWNKQYIASLGTRVTERLRKLQELSGGSSTPPASLLSGSRSADPAPSDADLTDEILETLKM